MDEVINRKSEIDHFFSTIQTKCDSYAHFMRLYESSLAPRFNLFDFIGPNENKLSEIIAFFLDPKASHGQGNVFLRIFLDMIGRTEGKEQDDKPMRKFLEAFEDNLNGTVKATLTLEKATDLIETSQRRIDIELNIGNIGLAIENKPWACDQIDQISDYNKQLLKRYGENRYLLIYLSGTGEPPSEDSVAEKEREALTSSGHLKILSYREFITCVNRFKKDCRSERVRCFLQDFEDYLRIQFEGGMAMYEKDMIKAYILEDQKNLEIALSVSQVQTDIKEKLLNDLRGILHQKCPTNITLDWCIDNFGGARYQSFSFKRDSWKKYKITFEFDGAQGRVFAYGVSKDARDDEEAKNISDIRGMADKLGHGGKSLWWPWYRDFEPPYYDWSISHEPWIEILNAAKQGESPLVNRIIGEVVRIAEVLDQMLFDDNGVPITDTPISG